MKMDSWNKYYNNMCSDDLPLDGIFIINPDIHQNANLTKQEFLYKVRNVKAIRSINRINSYLPGIPLYITSESDYVKIEQFYIAITVHSLKFLQYDELFDKFEL